MCFLDGTQLNLISMNECKKIHATPKYWELVLVSDTDLSSMELDSILTKNNISALSYDKDDGVKSEIIGYSRVAAINKVITGSIVLTITLQKDAEEDDCSAT